MSSILLGYSGRGMKRMNCPERLLYVKTIEEVNQSFGLIRLVHEDSRIYGYQQRYLSLRLSLCWRDFWKRDVILYQIQKSIQTLNSFFFERHESNHCALFAKSHEQIRAKAAKKTSFVGECFSQTQELLRLGFSMSSAAIHQQAFIFVILASFNEFTGRTIPCAPTTDRTLTNILTFLEYRKWKYCIFIIRIALVIRAREQRYRNLFVDDGCSFTFRTIRSIQFLERFECL